MLAFRKWMGDGTGLDDPVHCRKLDLGNDIDDSDLRGILLIVGRDWEEEYDSPDW